MSETRQPTTRIDVIARHIGVSRQAVRYMCLRPGHVLATAAVREGRFWAVPDHIAQEFIRTYKPYQHIRSKRSDR